MTRIQNDRQYWMGSYHFRAIHGDLKFMASYYQIRNFSSKMIRVESARDFSQFPWPSQISQDSPGSRHADKLSCTQVEPIEKPTDTGILTILLAVRNYFKVSGPEQSEKARRCRANNKPKVTNRNWVWVQAYTVCVCVLCCTGRITNPVQKFSGNFEIIKNWIPFLRYFTSYLSISHVLTVLAIYSYFNIALLHCI